MKIYIAGPMTSIPGWNVDGFAEAEGRLQAMGHEPINPHRLHPTPPPWRPNMDTDRRFQAAWAVYLKKDIAVLVTCDRVALLPGWRKSRGACVEALVAFLLGIEVAEYPGSELLPCDMETANLMALAAHIINDIIGSNSAKHGGHVEWLARTPQYHLEKAGRHALTAISQLNYHEEADEENAHDHAERVLTRGIMALHQMMNI